MQLRILQGIFDRPAARATPPPTTPFKPFIGEGVAVHKNLTASENVSAFDEDEPIFPSTCKLSEAPAQSQPDYWGLGPSGMKMRSRSPFSVVNNSRVIGAASSQLHGRQQQDRSSSWIASKSVLNSSTTHSTSLRASSQVDGGISAHSQHKVSCQKEGTEDVVADSLPKRSCLRKPGDVGRNIRNRISWARGGVVTDEKEIKPYKADASDLWYVNGYDLECNICNHPMSKGGDAPSLATMRGAPGKSRFAQWQTVCVDCFAKERLAEIGGLQVLSFAAKDDRCLRGYMRKMLQDMQKATPLATGQDTLLYLMRSLQNRGLQVAGCSKNEDDLDKRKKALDLAVRALMDEEKRGIGDASEKKVAKKQPQKSSLVKKRPAIGAVTLRRRSARTAPRVGKTAMKKSKNAAGRKRR